MKIHYARKSGKTACGLSLVAANGADRKTTTDKRRATCDNCQRARVK